MRFVLFVSLALVTVGCGPRKPEAKAGQTYFWRATGSAVDFSMCTDDPKFRESIKPIEIQDNSYFAYKVNDGAKTASTQTCTRVDPSTCSKSATDFDFDIAGTELIFTEELKRPIMNTTCKLQFTDTWVFADEGETGKLEIGEVLSLVDDPAECTRVENDLKARSPNMLGVQGCTVRFSVNFSFR